VSPRVRQPSPAELEGALARVAALTGRDDDPARGAEERLDAARAALRALLDASPARTGSRALAELYELALTLERLTREQRESGLARQLEALQHVRDALSRLREIESVGQMVDRATEELCRTCGFDRAVLFKVQGSEMVAESVCDPTDPEWAAEILATARTVPAHLDHLLLETEMIRRRGPVLVADPVHDTRTHKELVALFRTSSYVAAPVMPEGRVICFLHADMVHSGRAVDEVDRDTLWTFAEAFGYALDRTILLERLRTQRRRVTETLAATEAIMAELSDADHDLTGARGGGRARRAAGPPAALAALLTRRELEVLELMADGQTNSVIATRLVISPTTVKSHVKAILRKLQAANRAEAVARYIRYSMASTGSENSISASSVLTNRP
jgi:DNA-binding CsgD family transcriptional regulator